MVRASNTMDLPVSRLLAALPDAHAEALLAALPMGVMFTDMDDRVNYLNPALARLLQAEHDGADCLGRHASHLLGRLAGPAPGAWPAPPDPALAQHDPVSPGEIETADGRILACSVRTLDDADCRPLGRLWLFEDVTQAARTRRHLLHLADHDVLTGLFNRRRLREELERALVAGERTRQRVALLIFDLDRFKDVNDLYGHGAGDALLMRMAATVSGQIRRNEILARLGGDEFAILVPEASAREVEALAERIVRAVSGLPLMFKGYRRRQTCSVGVAIFPDHARTAEGLLECADAAMYRAKEAGRNHWRIWHEWGQASRQEKIFYDWEVRIDEALDQDRMRLHFQGAYACATGALSHLGALVRLQDGDNPARVILPGSFMQVAERNGRILDIDRRVVQGGIRILRRHPRPGGLAIKLSARSLADAGSAAFILDALERAGVDPARLIVEVTEEAVTADIYQAQRFAAALRGAGSRVCLTRFGSGFASFSCLRHLEADLVKIDDAFLQQLPGDQHNQACVKAMVDLAHGLGRSVLAGGIEDAATHRVLQALGLDYVQGHHFDRPSASHPALAPITRH